MRLIEVALDLGEGAPPDNRYFEELLKLSSGRISQLFAEGSASKLGAESLSRLVAKGFNPDWIQYGKPHEKYLRDAKTDVKTLSASSSSKRALVRRVCDIAETIDDVGLRKIVRIMEGVADLHPLQASNKKPKAA